MMEYSSHRPAVRRWQHVLATGRPSSIHNPNALYHGNVPNIRRCGRDRRNNATDQPPWDGKGHAHLHALTHSALPSVARGGGEAIAATPKDLIRGRLYYRGYNTTLLRATNASQAAKRRSGRRLATEARNRRHRSTTKDSLAGPRKRARRRRRISRISAADHCQTR
jgi:hypothetical protein